MQLIIDADQQNDGRWVAHVTDLPGVRVYGATRDEAVTNAHALAMRVLDMAGGKACSNRRSTSSHCA